MKGNSKGAPEVPREINSRKRVRSTLALVLVCAGANDGIEPLLAAQEAPERARYCSSTFAIGIPSHFSLVQRAQQLDFELFIVESQSDASELLSIYVGSHPDFPNHGRQFAIRRATRLGNAECQEVRGTVRNTEARWREVRCEVPSTHNPRYIHIRYADVTEAVGLLADQILETLEILPADRDGCQSIPER